MSKQIKRKVIVLGLLLALFLIAMCGYGGYTYINELKTFSIEKWDNNVYQREMMLDDFLERYDLIGMSYDEVIEILGTNKFDGNKYLIGKSYVGPIFFSITFNEKNRVESYGVIID